MPVYNGKQRQSNMDLLRILAMFMVLMSHANFYTLGTPLHYDIQTSPISSFTRIFFNSFSVIGVNVFVLLSGWFSINATKINFLKFIFQIYFFSFGIYIFFILLGTSITTDRILNCLYISKWDWFIKAYLGLYLLSPVLNAYVKTAPKKEFEYLLGAFFVFQTVLSYRGNGLYILNGYSQFSFMGLYLLGRYLQIYWSKKIKLSSYLALFIVLITTNGVLYTIDIWMDTYIIAGYCQSYANPINIIAAGLLLLLFSKIKIKHINVISWVATSSFAVYLLHYDQNILKEFYCKICILINESSSGITLIFLYIIFFSTIFFIAVIIDKIRINLWDYILQKAKHLRFATTTKLTLN